MILPCTSPPNAIYANMKARKLGVARPVRLFWPVIKNGGWNRTARPDALCKHSRMPSGTALRAIGRRPTTENGNMWPQCCMVGIRLTISRQCDMVVSPVGRHSGRSAFRQSNTQDRNFYHINCPLLLVFLLYYIEYTPIVH